MAENEPGLIYVDERSLNDSPPKWLKHCGCNGVIMRAQTQKIAQMVEDLGVPAVDTLNQIARLKASIVISDPQAVAQLAADHLLERGFQHFAFVGVDGAQWSDMRRDALFTVLGKEGFKCSEFSSSGSRRSAAGLERDQQELGRWLCALPKPVGIISPFDLRARQVLDAYRWNGLAVPDQIAVIGVGNDEVLCNLGEPPLTSVKLNFELLGYQAAALLDQLMRGNRAPKKMVMIKPLGVTTRRSTDIVAIDDAITAQASLGNKLAGEARSTFVPIRV
jgi:LacI family transcriptional regulator